MGCPIQEDNVTVPQPVTPSNPPYRPPHLQLVGQDIGRLEPLQVVRGAIGSALSLNTTGSQDSSPVQYGSEVSWNSPSPAIFTGNLSLDYQPSSPSVSSNAYSGTQDTTSLHEAAQQMLMFGRNTLEWREPNLISAENPFLAPELGTGTQYGSPLSSVTSWQFPQPFVFKVLELSAISALTIRRRLVSSEMLTSSGVILGQASQGPLGQPLVWTLTLKIPTRSFGMVIEVTRMLSLMNFVELYRSPISSVGWTGIRSLWKSRVPRRSLARRTSGSLRISIPENGTQESMPLR